MVWYFLYAANHFSLMWSQLKAINRKLKVYTELPPVFIVDSHLHTPGPSGWDRRWVSQWPRRRRRAVRTHGWGWVPHACRAGGSTWRMHTPPSSPCQMIQEQPFLLCMMDMEVSRVFRIICLVLCLIYCYGSYTFIISFSVLPQMQGLVIIWVMVMKDL